MNDKLYWLGSSVLDISLQSFISFDVSHEVVISMSMFRKIKGIEAVEIEL